MIKHDIFISKRPRAALGSFGMHAYANARTYTLVHFLVGRKLEFLGH